MVSAFLSSQCEVRDIKDRGKGIVAIQSIMAMNLLAVDAIITNIARIEFPFTVEYGPWNCSQQQQLISSGLRRMQDKDRKTVTIQRLEQSSIKEYVFEKRSSGQTKNIILPLIQLVNHGEGKEVNACVFITNKFAFLFSTRLIASDTEILFSYHGDYPLYPNFRQSVPSPRFLRQFQSSSQFEFIQQCRTFLSQPSYDPSELRNLFQIFYQILQDLNFQRNTTFTKHVCWMFFYPLLKNFIQEANHTHQFPETFYNNILKLLLGPNQQLDLSILLSYCGLMNVYYQLMMEKHDPAIQLILTSLVDRFPSIQSIDAGPHCTLSFPFTDFKREEKSLQQRQQQQDLQLSEQVFRFGLLGLQLFPTRLLSSRRG